MFVLRSALGTQNRTYLHTRAFLDPVDPGRFDPRTNEREVMPAPSARTYTSMYRQAMEYQSLLGTDPSAAGTTTSSTVKACQLRFTD